jgi:hypothetical protein
MPYYTQDSQANLGFIKFSGRWGQTEPTDLIGGLKGDAFSPFTMSYQDGWTYE